MPIVQDPVCKQDIDTDAVNAQVSSVVSGAPGTDPAQGTTRGAGNSGSATIALPVALARRRGEKDISKTSNSSNLS